MDKKENLDWKLIRSEKGPDLKLFNARFDYLQNPRNGIVEKMIIIESQDATNVVPILPSGHILFVKQFRFGTKQVTIELPGGIVDPGEEVQIAIARELREETGYSSSDWTYLGKMASNPVFMDNYIHHWIAKGIELTDDLDLDDGEVIAPIILSDREVRHYLKTGKFQHPHTMSALTMYYGTL